MSNIPPAPPVDDNEEIFWAVDERRSGSTCEMEYWKEDVDGILS